MALKFLIILLLVGTYAPFSAERTNSAIPDVNIFGESGYGLNAYEELNAEADLPFPLLMPYSEFTDEDKAAYSFIYGFGCDGYEKDGTRITFSGWPDVVDEFHLTEYILEDDAHSFFGISVGDDIAESVETLIENGYEVIAPADYPNMEHELHMARLEKDGEIGIHLYGAGKIQQIYIMAATTNVNDVMF